MQLRSLGLLRLIQKGHWASSALVGVEHDLCSGIGVTRRHHDIHTVDDGSLATDPEKKSDRDEGWTSYNSDPWARQPQWR
ncbi:hypothetical protein [Rhodococcoides fascians]|uniref:hypothetical protein n=1 Tax=Rhodococcoides fascians TaxID=1828 RepID=UPI00050CBC3C|nr:hypothetical protein [Rhodococcus fascians]